MNPSQITIRTDIKPGDIGEIIRLHGITYSQEYGWDYSFEGYVAASFGEYVQSADHERSRLWIVERQDQIAGSIGIVGRKGMDEAQLRWFLLTPELRGQRYGYRLMEAAVQFCCQQSFSSIYLWTVRDLTTAARLYQAFDFVEMEELTHPLWGKMITEVRYQLLIHQ